MNLELKYKFNDEVYVVFKEDDGMVRVFKDKVKEISMSEEYGLNYYVDRYDEFKEEELIPVDRPDLLVERIDMLLEEE